MMNWILGGFFLFCIILLILVAETIRKMLNGKPEITRKFVHIVTGLFITITPFVFKSHYPILAIALLFIPLNYSAIKWDIFKSIHDTKRKSYGTVFYPLAFFILTYLLWNNYKVVLVTSILILALADAIAAIVGKRMKQPLSYTFGSEPKSLQGSLAMFITSVIIVFFSLYLLGFIDSIELPIQYYIGIAIITGIIATACESVSYRGSDNLTVPLGAAFTIHYMIIHYPNYWGFIFGFALSLLIALVSYRLKFLDGGGTVATFLLGVLIFGIGGWKFALPILSFFILSSILSKVGKQKKQKISDRFQKSSQRDLWQVFANGGIAGLIVLLWNYYPHDLWYYLYVGSIAAANADTWGTEIGLFSKTNPRNILNFKPVPVGSSGGITPVGTIGAFLGSMIIVGVAATFFNSTNVIVLIIISGFIGSIIDSLLGATIQVQYQCPNCYKITEKITHCDKQKTSIVSGWKWVDNDVVNSVCTLSGAFLTWIGVSIMF